MSFVVGLTGGIGSGKSAVADLFSAFGVAVVDTDAIAHDLTGKRGAAMPAIIAEFGSEVVCPDGRLDRAAMRQKVFSDPMAKSRLEVILHPMIRREADERCRAAESPYVLLVVDCDEETQISRVVARSGLSVDEVRAIMATQALRATRRAMADDIVENDADMASLGARVDELHQRYLTIASERKGSNG